MKIYLRIHRKGIDTQLSLLVFLLIGHYKLDAYYCSFIYVYKNLSDSISL